MTRYEMEILTLLNTKEDKYIDAIMGIIALIKEDAWKTGYDSCKMDMELTEDEHDYDRSYA